MLTADQLPLAIETTVTALAFVKGFADYARDLRAIPADKDMDHLPVHVRQHVKQCSWMSYHVCDRALLNVVRSQMNGTTNGTDR